MRKMLMPALGLVLLLGACEQPTQTAQSDLALGLEAIKEGRLNDAEQNFNAILASDPNDPFANLNLGLVKASTGRREEAIGHYQLAAANGENVSVQSLVKPGVADSPAVDTTVAELARQNLNNLGV